MLVLELFQAGAEIAARFGAISQQVLLVDEIDHRLGLGGRHGIAAEGGDGEAGDGIGYFGASHGQSDRRAVAQAFGAGHNIWDHAPLLDAEPLAAGAAPAGLDLIAYEDAAVVAHDLLDNREVLFGRRDEAGHALDGFSDEAGDPSTRGAADQFLHVLGATHFATRVGEAEGTAVTVGVVRMHDAGLRRPQLPGTLSREPHPHRRTAVVGMAQRHDLGVAGVAAGGEDGGLIGLGSAVGEETLGELAIRRDGGDLLGQSGLRLIGEHGGDVLQGINLLVDLGVDLVVAMAHAHGDDPAEEVQVLIAVGVPDILILGARDDQRLLIVMKDGGEEEFLISENDFVFSHGLYLDHLAS